MIALKGLTWGHLKTRRFWTIVWFAFKGIFTHQQYMMGGSKTYYDTEGLPWLDKYMVVGICPDYMVRFFEKRGYKAIYCGHVFFQDVWFFER